MDLATEAEQGNHTDMIGVTAQAVTTAEANEAALAALNGQTDLSDSADRSGWCNL